jgi:SAM-dependent methyltransferase
MNILRSLPKDTMSANYDDIYKEGSSRLAVEGLIGLRYRLPKYGRLLEQRYASAGPLDILEIGAGVGEMSRILKSGAIQIKRYVTTEYSYPAVARMKRDGFQCAQVSAEELPFKNDSFDLVFCIDVMHHVGNPERMAHEMVRVTRKHFFLCEANGISPVRRLVELTPLAKSLGEQSYLPGTYRSFFPKDQVSDIQMRPFYVLVPPKVPERLIPLVAAMSETGERVPVFRWIGQSLLIAGQKQIRA